MLSPIDLATVGHNASIRRHPKPGAPKPSDACGKHHVANLPDHVVVSRITESSIVNKPVRHVPRSCPSSDGLRRVPMSDVAMKVRVANRLEKYNLAVVRRVWVGLKPTDGRFQLRSSPRVRRAMFSEPLLAHPAKIGRVHATRPPHPGDEHERDRHDDDTDEQHVVLAVIGSAWRMTIVALAKVAVCALMHMGW